MVKLKRLLVVGGTGFLGKHIVKKGVKLGYKITSISLNRPKIKDKIMGVKYHQLDIRKKKNFLKLSRNFDYVVNAGGYGGYSTNDNIYKNNNSQYQAIKNLSNFFLKTKLKKFIQLGTCLEYGNIERPNIETMFSKQPITNYGKSKLYSTIYLKFLFKFFNFPVVIFRLYQVYGPQQDNNRLIGYLINSIQKNKKIFVSRGEQIRDFLYISDFVNAIFLAIKSNRSSGEIINVGSGRGHKVKKVIKIVLSHFHNKKIKININKKNTRKELKRISPDISKAKRIINWTPKINLKDGIIRTIKEL